MQRLSEMIEQGARKAITNPFIATALLALLFVVIHFSPEGEDE